MKVHWTARSVARLEAIQAYIATENPTAALNVVQQMLRRSRQIASFPHSGRRVTDYARDDVRELIEGQYRIIYRVEAERIEVLTVKHVSQRLPIHLRHL